MDERQAQIVISADTDQYTSSVNESYESTNRLNQALNQTSKSLDGIIARAGKKLALFGSADLAALGSAVTVAATLDKQMSTLNATATGLGKSAETTFKTQMRDGIRAISREIPVARGEIVQLATTITKMGQTSATTITSLTSAFAKFGAATGESPFALAQSQLGLSRTMGTFTGAPGTNRPKIVENFNDSVTGLSQKGGVSAQSILDFSQMLAPTARMAGISQTDLLGISTAFNRSGADGSYAANTFNQIVNDLMERRITGDPRLRTFQNQLGLSNRELKSANPAEIFSQLVGTVSSQGQRGISTLNALGIDGIRAQRAIQSLAAEGNIDKYIDISRNQYGQGGTDRAAKEAFSGLFDSIEKIKNNFTDLAQVLGQSFLPAVNKTAEFLATAVSKISGALQPFLKMLGPVMAGGGATALAGAGMLGIWAKMGPLAMGRWALNTRPGLGLKEGFRMGKVGGDLDRMTPEQLGYAGAVAREEVGPASRAMYRTGAVVGMARGWLAEQTGGQGGIIRQGVAGLGAAGRWFGDQTRLFYNQSTAASGYDKLGPNGGRRGFLSSFTGAVRGGAADTFFGRANAESIAATRSTTPGLFASMRTNIDAARNAKTFSVMATEAGRAAVSFGRVAVAANKAAASLAGSGLGLAARGAGRGLAAIGGGLMNLAGGPQGLAIMAALGGGMAAKSIYDNTRRKEINFDDEKFSNGLSAYNEKLGLASDSLTSFKDALNAVTGDLNKRNTYKSVARDSSLYDEASKSKDYTDRRAVAVNDNLGALAWLKSEGNIGPDRFREIAIDLYRRAQSGADIDVKAVLSQYTKQRRTGNLNSAAGSYGGDALKGALQTVETTGGTTDQFYKQFTAPAIANLLRGNVGNIPLPFSINGRRMEITSPLNMLMRGVVGKESPRRYEMNAYNTEEMQQAAVTETDRILQLQSKMQNKYSHTPKDVREIDSQVRGDAYNTLVGLLKENTPAATQGAQLFADALRTKGEIKGAQQFDFSSVDWTGKSSTEIAKILVENKVFGKLDLNKVQGFLEENLSGKLSNRVLSIDTQAFLGNKDFKGIAGFRDYAKDTGESKILDRAELRSNDPNLQWKAIQAQRAAANRASGGNLQQNDVLYDTTLAQYVEGPRADIARAAQELDAKERAFRRQFLNRPAQVSGAIEEWQSTMRSPDSTTGIGQKRFAAAETAKQAIADLYMTLQQYDRQMEREEEDFYQNRAWSMEDFYRSRRQSTAAYHRQMLYSEQEFNIQRKRSEDEYQRSLRRSTAQHARELRREEKSYTMQRAWSVEDYNRSVMRSEEDYQRQVRLQKRDFNISLQRSEEDYAKQRKRSDFDFNLSRARGVRDFNIGMQRSNEDYLRQLKYGEEDYQKSRKRSTDDFNLSMARSFEDYNKSRRREQEDHFLQLERMSKDAAKNFYDPWLRVQSQATAGIDTFMENLRDQTDRIQRQFNNLKQLRSRGLSQDVIDMFGLSDPNKAQQLQRLTTEITDQQINELNRLTRERNKNVGNLTQSDFNEQFRRMEEDRNKSLRRGEEDFKLSIERSVSDFRKSMARMAEDYQLSLARGAEQFRLAQRRSVEDFLKSMNDSAEDYQRSIERSDEDFRLSLSRSREDFQRSLNDSEYQYRLSLSRGEEDFKRSLDRQDRLRKISLRQAAEDWNRMLGQQARDYARSVRNMLADHRRAVAHSNQEFRISMNIAMDNFQRQLSRADIQREKMLKRSRQDLIGYGKQVFGDYGDIMGRLSGLLRKYMGSEANALISKLGDVHKKLFNFGKNTGNQFKDNFTRHVDGIINEMNRAVNRALKLAQRLASGMGVAGGVGARGGLPTPREDGGGSWAVGGVATGRVDNATVGEGGPELILPLNTRGMDYLTSALRQYASTDALRMRGTQSMFYQPSQQGSITNFNFGDVSVASETPDQFYKEMKQKENLKKLVGHR